MAGHETQAVIRRASEEEICSRLLDVQALDIRDVDGGEDPFHYSSGNFGPGYVDVKGTVAEQSTFKFLVGQVARKLVDEQIEFDNVAGNATGGMVPAYQCREDYQKITLERKGYVYIRGSRKKGGQGELITGLQHIKPLREDGSPAHWLVMEELVNFAETTTNSILELRSRGFVAEEAATILEYGHEAARTKLRDNGINLTPLVKLPRLLDAAVELDRYPEEVVDSYRSFLSDPGQWMNDRGLENEPHERSK